jgi:menaquinol-cytochrome c reductase iron-sulfur subunit
MDRENAVGRRRFYLACIYGLSALMGAALSLPAAVYLLLPPRAKKNDEWVEAADVTRLPSNGPEEVVFRRNRVDGWKVISEKATAWVVKGAGNEVAAFTPQCTHLGCAYHWDEQKQYFICPCHTSAFGLDGKVLTGPAPRPLDRYRTRIENGKLLIGPPAKPGERG